MHSDGLFFTVLAAAWYSAMWIGEYWPLTMLALIVYGLIWVRGKK